MRNLIALLILLFCTSFTAQAQIQTLLNEDFEPVPTGWTVDPNGNDAATAGDWAIGNPTQTSFQNGTTASGTNALVTDPANTTDFDLDVDGGATSVSSPPIAISANAVSATLAAQYYFRDSFDDGVTDDANFNSFTVSVVNTVTSEVSTIFSRTLSTSAAVPPVYSAINGAAGVDLSDFAGQTIQLVFSANGGSGAGVEASVDNVVVTQDITPQIDATVQLFNNADGDSFFTEFEYGDAGPQTILLRATITNGSAVDALTITSLTDSDGAVAVASCDTNPIPASGSAVCTYSRSVTLVTSDSIVNTLTVNATQGAATGSVSDSTTYGSQGPEGPGINDTFFVPYPEDQVLAALQSIQNPVQCSGSSPAPVNDVTTLIGITVLSANTIIYYDHQEDGFEPVLEAPVQPSTLVWGDGDLTNGVAPGFATDLIPAGSEIVLRNDVDTTTLDSVIDFDGGDKITGTFPIAATRAAWANGPEALLAGALEMYNTNEQWGRTYEFPIGEDLSVASGEAFEYVGASITAQEDGTTVNVDVNNDGDFTDPGDIDGAILNEGESVAIDGGIVTGATIDATADVRVDIITGDVCSNYEARFYTLFPRETWANSYYNPVTSSTNAPSVVTLYNPDVADITVTIAETDGAGGITTSNVTVPGDGIFDFTMPADSGTRFFTDPAQNGGAEPVFYAVVAVDQDNSAPDSSTNDWGITLVPQQFLSTQVLVGTGIGRDPNSAVNPNENGSPIWLTVAKNGNDLATNGLDICIDYDGDGLDSAADVAANPGFYNQGTDPVTTREFDTQVNLDVFESLKIFDPDGDQSGMLLFVCDNDDDVNFTDQREGVITAAWGQDPDSASAAQPGLDAGTGIPNLRAILVSKRSAFSGDLNNDGEANIGDVISYQIDVSNTGLVPLATTLIEFEDLLPSQFVDYIVNSTTLNPNDGSPVIAIPDDPAPRTPFPIDREPGEDVFQIPLQIGIGETVTFEFEVIVTLVPFAVEEDEICNNTAGSVFNENDTDEECVPVSINNGVVSGSVTEDIDGDGVGDIPVEGVTILLYSDPLPSGSPLNGSIQRTTQTAADGSYEFTDLQAGDYIVVEVDPDTYVSVVDADEENIGDIDAEPNTFPNDNAIPVSVAQADRPTIPPASPLVPESIDTGNNFVDERFASIDGVLWLDEDQDGILDIEETRFTNALVNLCNAPVAVPECDSGDPEFVASTTTDQNGNYFFGDLRGGDYQINVDDSTLPPNLDNTAGQFGVDPRLLTLPVGGSSSNENFGYIAEPNTGIIGDRVWSDANGNGIQDAGEAGINNVDVELLDSTGAVVATTETTADGDYLFTNVPFAEDYVVRVVAADPQLAGYTPTVGPQSEGGFISDPVSLDVNLTTVTDVDFGFDNPATLEINDRVWFDENSDGIAGIDEPGIAGVTIDLLDSNGDIVATTTTDANGDFSFTGVPDGNDYQLLVSDRSDELNGLNETTTTGGIATIAGPLSAAAGPDGVLDTIGDDGTDTFGYNNSGLIAGTVYSDPDSSASQDPNEPGLAGIQVTLEDGDGNVIATTTTAPDGSYMFDGLTPGDYVVIVSQPNGTSQTEDPDAAQDNQTSITLDFGESSVGNDFGYVDPGLNNIFGTVFLDPDKDGVEDSGEPGIPGITLDLIAATPAIIDGMVDTNGDGVIDATDDGAFGIFDVIDGMIDLDNDGDIDEDDSSGLSGNGQVAGYGVVAGMLSVAQTGTANQSTTLRAGFEAATGIDGVPSGSGGLGGYPHTGNPGPTTTEYWQVDLGSSQAIADITVFNRDELIFDGRLENVALLVSDTPFPDDAADFTGALANATFVDLFPVITDASPDPTIAVNASGRYVRLQKTGGNLVNGVAVPNIGESGGETIINFAEIKITPASVPASTSVIASTTTDANGDYSFEGLPDGDYQVAVTDQTGLLAGYDITSGLDVLNATIAGADVTDVDFGYIRDEATGAISGEVFLDENGNNLAESTETNFSGVDVYLCSNPLTAPDTEPCDPTDTNSLIAQTVTDANGEYAFTGLPAGSYLVDVDPNDLPAGLSNTVDPAPVALSEGETVDEVDFGYVPAPGNGLISGVVWTDDNDDGVFDNGEAPIGNVTINVFDPNSATPSTPIGTVDTAPDGSWSLTLTTAAGTLVDDLIVQYDAADIPANLDSTQPTNLVAGVTQYDGDNVDVASDPDRNITDLNFGFSPNVAGSLGSIAGTIYSDTDANGDYLEATDGEFEGITIDLRDSSGNVVASTITDENGDYSFTGLQDDAVGYSVVVTDLGNVLQDLNVNETIVNPIPIVGGNDVTEVDQGYVSNTTPTLGSIGNLLFVDVDSGAGFNGFADLGEPRLPGVSVQCWLDADQSATPNDPSVPVPATDPEPGIDNLVRTVVTDENGEYYCTNLPEGQYIIKVADSNFAPGGALVGFTDTSPNNTTNSPADSFAKPFTYSVTTTAGNTNLTADFGVEANASISGTVYFDDNVDGDYQVAGTDVPQQGIEVQACNENDLCITVFTEADGSYTIPVGPGNWTVTVITPPGGTDPLEVPTVNPIPVAQGDAITEVDFGYIDRFSDPRGSISGVVEEDTVGDGVGDTPIPGALIQLYTDPNGDGDPSDGALVASQLTDGSGAYLFENLAATNVNYVVSEVDPAGFASVSDEQSADGDVVPNTNSNDNLIPVTLTVAESDANNNFVDIVPASVAGTVWLDEDLDGINDIEEGGLTGIIVELVDAGDNVVATTVTDANGNYLFPDVVAGDYTVRVDETSLPAGLVATFGAGGMNDKPVSVFPGDRIEDVDFGYINPVGTGAIGDRVWNDANGDGIQDLGESGIEGVVVTLLDDSGVIVDTTVTNANGDYLFTSVPFGDDYVVTLDSGDAALAGYTPTLAAGTPGPQSEGGFVGNPVTLDASLTTVTDIDFGFNNPANDNTIEDTVWFDENGDGVFDPTESPISGVSINLYQDANNDGFPDDDDGDGQPDVVATAITDENGDVSFPGLADGTYILAITDNSSELTGLNGTTPEGVARIGDPIPVAGGQTVDGDNFGYNNPGLIAGTVYSDADNNGDQDAGETGFASVPVTLREDTTGDGNFDTIVAIVFTSPDGSYAFDGLPPGDYQVVVDAPNGTQSEDPDAAPDDATPITLGIGESSVENDFGYNDPALNDVSGTVFLDTDKDGVEEAGEAGIPVITLDLVAPPEVVIGGDLDINGDGVIDNTDVGTYLGTPVIDGQLDVNGDGVIDVNDDGVVNGTPVIDGQLDVNFDGVIDAADNSVLPEAVLATTTTDANGDYIFPDLPDGDYQVRVTDASGLLAGYDITSGLDELPVTVAGAPVTDVDFGYIREEATGSISGEVYIDESGDDLAQGEEPDLAGVTVYLCLAVDAPCNAGNAIQTTTTDVNGEYGFNDLPPGVYEVETDPATVPSGLTLGADPAPVSLSEGENVTDVDIGYDPTAALLSGVVWTDTDNDGNFDPGEAPIAGVTIQVFDAAGTLIDSIDSGLDGSWLLTGITGADLQDNLVIVYDSADVPAGLNNIQPSNLPLGDDKYGNQDLASEADLAITNLDFGFPPNAGVQLASIAGTIYSDGNQNGDYEPANDGELEGITLNLLDGLGNVIATTVTDENGNYEFNGLPPGDYQVVVTDLENVLQDLNPRELLPASITLAAGENRTEVDAGYESDRDLGSIGNVFFFDSNRDGIKQDDEPGIPGVTIQLWLDNDVSETPNDPGTPTGAPQPGIDNLVRTVTTDQNGEYYFTSLPTGQYIVQVVTDASGDNTVGYNEVADGTQVNITPADNNAKPWTYALTQVSGTPNLAADFGVSGNNNLSGSVFIETEGVTPDAVFDGANDDPAQGVPVVLLLQQPDGSFAPVQTTTTAADGGYSFGGLPDGVYRVEVNPENSVIDSFAQTADPDLPVGIICNSTSGCDSGSTVTLSGTPVSGIDFGYQKNFTTTPVTVNYFTATSQGDDVEFIWHTANEVGHVGYQIYARTDDGWVLLNEELITSADRDAMAKREYRFSASSSGAVWFALVDVSATEELTPHGPYRLDQAYGETLTVPAEFDWNGIELPSPSAADIQQSVNARLKRASQ